MNRWQKLEAYLLSGNMDRLELADLRAANLGAYVYPRLPEQHPFKQGLRPDFLGASLRHNLIKQTIKPIFQAFFEEKIEFVISKGFGIAEYYCKYPSDRHYGDVDILIYEKDLAKILSIAQSLNWKIAEEAGFGIRANPHLGNIFSPDLSVYLEIHGVIYQSDSRKVKRITKEFMQSSVSCDFFDGKVRVLQPVDAALTMYLNRAWNDVWARKPHDILDIRQLMNHGLTLQGLQKRASQLGVGLVLQTAMKTCNPWKQTLSLNPTRFQDILYWSIISFAFWGNSRVEYTIKRLQNLPQMLQELVWAVPVVNKIQKLLRLKTDLNQILSQLDLIENKTELNRIELLRLNRGILLLLRLQNRHKNSCVPRSLALFHFLRKSDVLTSFVSGVRRRGSTLEGHAWIEIEGQPVVGLGDENAPNIFKENFRYPKS